MTLYKWSQTSASDATADATINWAEGQAPSSVNDSARAMMAAMAKYRDDTGGLIGAGGTSAAYTVTTSQVFDTLAHLSGNSVSFVAGVTNAAGATLNVDGLGAKPIVTDSSGTPIGAGVLVAGTVYQVTYYDSVAQFRLWNLFADPFNIPIAGGMDYWGTTVPNSNFAFPIGQAISRTTYATLFALTGTTYGVGDGSTTFNLPDKTGRISAMKEASATRLTASFFGASGATLGAVGGLESNTLTTAQLAAHTHVNSLTDPGHTHTSNAGNTGGSAQGGVSAAGSSVTAVINSATTGISITNASAGSGSAHNNVQPTIICNYIIRIL